jgi:starch synthase
LVHAHDWHLGLLPALLAHCERAHPPVLFTIHNIAFQGVFPPDAFARLGLPAGAFTPDSVEYYGNVSFLKAGIRHAQRVTTVSPTYAREILTPEFGCGLDGVLRSRADRIVGILNGVDYERWNPESAASVPVPYNAADLTGKTVCKALLQEEFDLPVQAERPLIGYVSRLTEQKMADLLPSVVPLIAERGAQFVACGEGDKMIENAVRQAADEHRNHVSVRIGYDESAANRLLAGADMVLAPARFEPCGLVQLYAMRYGTLPIVRWTGGLADTVVPYTEAETGAASRNAATGFSFGEPSLRDLSYAIERACRTFRDRHTWIEMQKRAMDQDFAWQRPAQQYLELYDDVLGRGRSKLAA